MKIFDLHQDLMTHMRFRNVLGQSEQTSFDAIEKSDIDLVVATAFPMPPDNDQYHESAPSLITEELTLYHNFIDDNQDWCLIECAADLDVMRKKIILHIEGLNCFDGSAAAWQQLDAWREMGVRSIGTHWNILNQLGGGTLQPTEPLTELGQEVIAYIEQHHCILDMAHMGRRTWFDVAQVARRPLYVSHGNAATVCPHVRNYTDEQLKMVAASGGVIGVFFPRMFVTGATSADRSQVVAQIEYIRTLIGISHIAIGSDFGGIVSGCVDGLSHVSHLTDFLDDLRSLNYSESDLEAIAFKNADQVLRAHLQ